MYRLTVHIGVAFTSASNEIAEGSGVLRLSPFAVELPSAPCLTDDGLRTELLAETLRGIVETARQQLGEEPASVQVTYPASWRLAGFCSCGGLGSRRNSRCGDSGC